jgi:hypothetical protein
MEYYGNYGCHVNYVLTGSLSYGSYVASGGKNCETFHPGETPTVETKNGNDV